LLQSWDQRIDLCPFLHAPGNFQLAPFAVLHVRAEKYTEHGRKEKSNFSVVKMSSEQLFKLFDLARNVRSLKGANEA